MPPKKKDLKIKKRKPRKKTKVTNQNVNKQTVIIHNNATPQPAKRKYTRRTKPKEKDKFSVPTSSESFVLNLLSRFQNLQQPQNLPQLKNIPEPSPKMPHEKLEYDFRDDVSDISEGDGRTYDLDNISRFTGDDKSQVPKYGNLQAPIKEEEDVFQDATAEEEGSGGGAEEKQPVTPVQPKKKNEPSSASPAKTRNSSKRWEKYNDDLLLNEEQKYLRSLDNPKISENTKKTQKSNLINIRKEITRRNIR